MRIAINGFGRIGRSVFKIAVERGFNIVAINDIHGIEDASYLLKHDSIYGIYTKGVETRSGALYVNNKKTLVLSEEYPEHLPWKELDIDVVIESTGAFKDHESISKHLEAGAKRVITTAPVKNPDTTIVPGVNHKSLKSKHKIISVASCTTNCAAPIIKVLDEAFGIKRGLLTTVHAYTSSQDIVDRHHKRPRRGRAAAINIIPTTTGATKAICQVMPKMQGKLNGLALRVPVPDGSIIDLVVELNKKQTVEKVNETLRKAANGKMKGIIQYSEDDLVSTDIIQNPYSAIIDSKMTEAIGPMVKVLAWYDNEWGYSERVVDVLKLMKKFR
jgi:glyceraldehyde 3-phosphate dehydrogenase